MAELAGVTHLEQCITGDELAAHYHGAFKERWLKYRRAEGMPYVTVAGKVRYKLSEVVPWLETHGYIEPHNEAA
jgi:hypothetical protein